MILWDIPNHPAICVSQKFIYLDLRRNANVAIEQLNYWEKNQTMGSF